MSIKTIAIIGSGQMGSGIAQVAALAGYEVVLNDICDESLKKAVLNIEKSLQKFVDKEKISPENAKNTLSNIKTTLDINTIGNAELVIEAATENLEIKEKIFKNLAQIVKNDAILASNTSSISITKLASFTKSPERFIGMHFMNPVPLMKLVEIIKGLKTSDETFAAIKDVAEKMGKTTTCSEDRAGFILNRILIPMINEAVFVLEQNIGSVQSIDDSMKLGAAHPMGPLALADLIGLDTCLAIMQILHKELGEDKYRPSSLLAKYVEAGLLGRKTGEGFYKYN